MKFIAQHSLSKSSHSRYHGRARLFLLGNKAVEFILYPSALILSKKRLRGDFGGDPLFILQHGDELS